MYNRMREQLDEIRDQRFKARKAIHQNESVASALRKKGIHVKYNTGLQLVKILTTRKAYQVYKYDENREKYYDKTDTIVGYVIKNNSNEPCRYLKAIYGDKEISYEEAFINPNEQVIITRHELYGLRMFNGDRIQLPNNTDDEKKIFRGRLCMIVTSGKGKKFVPYIRGINYNLRGTSQMLERIDGDDGSQILPKYAERFSWLMNRNFFKNRFCKKN